MKNYVYHFCCMFSHPINSQMNGSVAGLYESENKIANAEEYDELKSYIYRNTDFPDWVYPNHLTIVSLSFLHEVDK